MLLNSITQMELTDCYNCTGAKTYIECGFPIYGCLLCKQYGNGIGKLQKEYRHKSVQIKDDDGNVHVFDPPLYTCLFCKDSKKVPYRIWDKELQNNSSDHGSSIMPRGLVACQSCDQENHKKDVEKAYQDYYANKKK